MLWGEDAKQTAKTQAEGQDLGEEESGSQAWEDSPKQTKQADWQLN